MQCVSPIFIKQRGLVPCGKCYACLINRQNAWSFRIMKEVEHSTSSWFITLTYDDNHLTYGEYDNLRFPIVNKRDIQLWFKRLRKHISPLGVKLRYFLCSEYGTQTFRPHYHAILFNLPFNQKETYEILNQTWNQGFITISPVSVARARYVAKYAASYTLLPTHLQQREYRPFFLSSKREGGIGQSYLSSSVKRHYRSNPSSVVRLAGGHILSMPRFYRNKLYDDDMKERLKEVNNLLMLKRSEDENCAMDNLHSVLHSRQEKIDFNTELFYKRLKQKKKL